jgi:hypothetical protein
VLEQILDSKKLHGKSVSSFHQGTKTKHDKTVKYIRCDNAGENEATNTACAKEGLEIQFEYTALGTPQQNGRVERKFATLHGRVQSMMNRANLPLTIRKGLKQHLQQPTSILFWSPTTILLHSTRKNLHSFVIYELSEKLELF